MKTVDLSGKLRGDRRYCRIAALDDFGSGSSGVGCDNGIEAECADQLAALRQCVNVASDRPDVCQARSRKSQQVVVHPLEMLADYVEVRARH